MVIKGTSCAGARRLAVHLSRTDNNERAEVKELRGVSAGDLRGALLEMEAMAGGARTAKPFYHASINTRADERLTDDQRMHAIDRLELELGLSGQPRVVVVHEKLGREHCHVVWSRVRLDTMTAISDSHNYRKHELVGRELERQFGHEPVQGAHVERNGKPRPKRTPSHAEMLQAERTGISPAEARRFITELWRNADSGGAFVTALKQHGWSLARGDRRDFVVIDPQGGIHSLARRIEGTTAAQVRAGLADLDPNELPTVAEVRKIQRARSPRSSGRARQNPQPALGWKSATAVFVGRSAGGRQADGRDGHGAEAPPALDRNPAHVLSRGAGSGRSGGLGSGFQPRSSEWARLPPHLAETFGSALLAEADLRDHIRAAAICVTDRAGAPDEGGGLTDAGDAGADSELSLILDAIVDDVMRRAAGAQMAIMAEYAGKVAYARRYLPRTEVAGAVRAAMDVKAAALAHIAGEAAAEIAARRAAIIGARRKQRRIRPSIWGGSPDEPQPR